MQFFGFSGPETCDSAAYAAYSDALANRLGYAAATEASDKARKLCEEAMMAVVQNDALVQRVKGGMERGTQVVLGGKTIGTPVVLTPPTTSTNSNTLSTTSTGGSSGGGALSLTPEAPPSLNPTMQADADRRAAAEREWRAKQDAIKAAQQQADLAAQSAMQASNAAVAAAAQAEQERLAEIAAIHEQDPAAPSGFLGVIAGAGAGFLVGGPVGAGIGGVLGFFLKK